MHHSLIACLAGSIGLALAGCSTPPPRHAQVKAIQIDGKRVELGGVYDPEPRLLRITVNGEPMLQGNFSRVSPTLKLNTEIHGAELSAQCYFGSILGGRAGVGGVVANAVQGGLGKGADRCDMLVRDKNVETLFF